MDLENFAPAHPIERLTHIFQILRSENGCPWDREQTHESLVPCLLEEVYEVVDAIERKDSTHLQEELGDLLFQIVFHSGLAEESGLFCFEDVAHRISEKLIRRHPHVFANKEGITTSGDVILQWDEIKAKEKPETKSLLDSVPLSLPAIQRAEKLQSKAAKQGFDWKNWQEPISKFREEWEEFEEELQNLRDAFPSIDPVKNLIPKDLQSRIESEFGDVLFSLVNIARHLGIDPEKSLRKANEKFSNRFRYLELEAKKFGKNLKDMSLPELDELWNQAKNAGL